MSISCPVCEKPIAGPATFCDGCGYPTALAEEAARALSQPEPALRGERPRRSSTPPPPRVRVDPHGDQARRVAQEIRGRLTVYERLGGDPGDVIIEVTQAALAQADGRGAEAVGLLKSADARLSTQTKDLFQRRARDLELRQQTLVKDGVAIDLSTQLTSGRARFESGHLDEGIGLLVEADQQLSKVESDWHALRALLKQIDALRDAVPPGANQFASLDEELARVRILLAHPAIDSATIEEATEIASGILEQLHEALPPAFEKELEAHAEKLDTIRADPENGRRARALHAEASRHLRRGRLADAGARLKELRTVLAAIEAEERRRPPEVPVAPIPPPAPAPQIAPAPPPQPRRPEDALPRLLEEAKILAARVRSLPPDSEVAFEAAAEIRRATEFLRARKLDEAERTLARLMRTLDAEHPQEIRR